MLPPFLDRWVSALKRQKAIPVWGWIFGALFIFSLGLWLGGFGTDANALSASSETDPLSTTSLMVGVFLRLIVVLGLMYGFFILLRQWQSNKVGGHKKRLSIVETLHLSPRRNLYLIRLEAREFLVGATDQTMNLIAELDEGLPVGALEKSTPPAINSFSSLLQQTVGTSGMGLFETGSKGK